MLYQWFELGHAAVRPARVAADSYRYLLSHPFNPMTHTSVGRHTAAALEVFERSTRRYDKPTFGFTSTVVDGTSVAVSEEVVWASPFCQVVHFRKDHQDGRASTDPKILLVAPMSGHFATLLRGTVETFLLNHDVYITDWQDARSVPLAFGAFDLDDYIRTMRDIFHHFAGDVHVFAVCQPSVPVLAATALMETAGDPNVPLSLSLAGGPIDTRVSPTQVNRLAVERGIEWFQRNVITTVPWPNIGAGRSVYPGFLQLTGFMTMNLDRHLGAQKDMFFHLVKGDGDSAEKHREFYDEYLAVMDLTSEFFLQTVERVFVEHQLPRGVMMHGDEKIDLAAIRRVPLLTIEGEKDDITGVGQCGAAIDLCSGLPASMKSHFVCPDVGHYGIFNGSRFRRLIAPKIAKFVRANERRGTGQSAAARSRRNAKSTAMDLSVDSEVSGAAFSFPSLTRLEAPKASAKSHADQPGSRAGVDPLDAMTSMLPLKMWGMVGSMFIESLTCFTPALGKPSRDV